MNPEPLMSTRSLLLAVLAIACTAAAVAAPPEITEALVIAPGRTASRSPVWTDPVEHAWVIGEWTTPAEGDTVTRTDGQSATWSAANFNESGTLNSPALRNGYALVTVESDIDQIVMLEASGHSAVRVNGESRAGDPYNYGFVKVPIKLDAGDNELLFRCARGRLKVALSDPPAQVFFLNADDTLPDLVGTESPGPAGIVVVNASSEWATIALRAQQNGTNPPDEFITNASFTFAPLSVRKLPILLPTPGIIDGSAVQYSLTLSARDLSVAPPRVVEIKVKTPDQRHDRTFISTIDGSAQYYTVVPPAKPIDKPALVLTLHGASVEARGQAAAYAPKDWAAIVAPTNRRPFGFDWEDWGRLDAIEVLDLATASLNPDPARIYLTGHSMGGHGTWNIGVNFPDRFAAIAPSAGWVSFWSYTGAADFNAEKSIEGIMRRAVSSSDTLSLAENLNHNGVYILHGDADDNVPVTQARTMRTELAKFHSDFAYYEQPGAGHWWGNQCVDWPPLFDYLKSHTTPAQPRTFVFTTPDPGINDRCHWLRIIQQQQWGIPTRIEASATSNGIELKTNNAQLLTLNLERLTTEDNPIVPAPDNDAPLTIKIDDTELEIASKERSSSVSFRRDPNGSWRTATLVPDEKNPARTGPFKSAFRNHLAFVVGNDQWSLAKARYDAETFWYRGNGSIDIIEADALDLEDIAERNIVVYGNEAFEAVRSLLNHSNMPVEVEGGSYTIGNLSTRHDPGSALLAIMPGASDSTLIAVVAGVDQAGERLCEQVPVFVSGIGYPDWTVLTPDMLKHGFDGIIGAGFFDQNWRYSPEQSAWKSGLTP